MNVRLFFVLYFSVFSAYVANICTCMLKEYQPVYMTLPVIGTDSD